MTEQHGNEWCELTNNVIDITVSPNHSTKCHLTSYKTIPFAYTHIYI